MGCMARFGVPGRCAIRIRHGREGRRSASALHHRLRFRTRVEPQGALSLRTPRRASSWVSVHTNPAQRRRRRSALASLEGLGYVVDYFDRGSYRREDPIEVARLRAREDARVLLIARDMPLLRNAEKGLDALLPMREIDALGGAQVEAFLGLAPDGAPIFIALLVDEAAEVRSDTSDGFLDRRILVVPGRDDLKLLDLRSIAIGGLVPQDQTAMLAAAKALMHWHARHRFCSNCWAPTEVAVAGWRRDCPHCKAIHFPRTDPVVIMLAVDGDACLLGRQPRFPKGMYSALAGFVEPGETIEAAVSRDETIALLERRHPEGLTAPTPMAIAHHLLKRWAYKAVTFGE